MEKQNSFRSVTFEKQPSLHRAIEKQNSFHGRMEKQKSFRIAMERQLSFGGETKKSIKDSPGKRGDSALHLAARAGNLIRVKEILRKCDPNTLKDLLSKQNQEGETVLYAAAENGHASVVAEFLKYSNLHTASIPARNGYDPFHVAANRGHLGIISIYFSAYPLPISFCLFCLSFTIFIDSNLSSIILRGNLGLEYDKGRGSVWQRLCL